MNILASSLLNDVCHAAKLDTSLLQLCEYCQLVIKSIS